MSIDQVFETLNLKPELWDAVRPYLEANINKCEVRDELVHVRDSGFSVLLYNINGELYVSANLSSFARVTKCAQLGSLTASLFICGDMDIASVIKALKYRLNTNAKFIKKTLKRSMR